MFPLGRFLLLPALTALVVITTTRPRRRSLKAGLEPRANLRVDQVHVAVQGNDLKPGLPIAVTYIDPASPITKGLADWTTIQEEF